MSIFLRSIHLPPLSSILALAVLFVSCKSSADPKIQKQAEHESQVNTQVDTQVDTTASTSPLEEAAPAPYALDAISRGSAFWSPAFWSGCHSRKEGKLHQGVRPYEKGKPYQEVRPYEEGKSYDEGMPSQERVAASSGGSVAAVSRSGLVRRCRAVGSLPAARRSCRPTRRRSSAWPACSRATRGAAGALRRARTAETAGRWRRSSD